MSIETIYDPDKRCAALVCNTTEIPLPCPLFRDDIKLGTAEEQADDFLAGLPRPIRFYNRVQLIDLHSAFIRNRPEQLLRAAQDEKELIEQENS
jgi:hypothetical protein